MAWSDLTNGISGAAEAVGDAFGGALQDAGTFSFDIPTDFMDDIFDEVSGFFDEAGDFTSGAEELGGGVVDMFANAKGGEMIKQAGSAVKDAAADEIQKGADPLGKIFDWAKGPQGRNALASGALALYKKRRMDQMRKDQHENNIERDTLKRKHVGAYYV